MNSMQIIFGIEKALKAMKCVHNSASLNTKCRKHAIVFLILLVWMLHAFQQNSSQCFDHERELLKVLQTPCKRFPTESYRDRFVKRDSLQTYPSAVCPFTFKCEDELDVPHWFLVPFVISKINSGSTAVRIFNLPQTFAERMVSHLGHIFSKWLTISFTCDIVAFLYCGFDSPYTSTACCIRGTWKNRFRRKHYRFPKLKRVNGG